MLTFLRSLEDTGCREAGGSWAGERFEVRSSFPAVNVKCEIGFVVRDH